MSKAADQKHCFSCGTIIHISAPTCPSCGAAQPAVSQAVQTVPAGAGQLPATVAGERLAAALPPHHIFCRGCGHHIHETARACPKCGALQNVADSGQRRGTGRSKVAAALFAILLGGVGAHKFYLGSVGLGFLYLVFFWTFIPAFIALIEGILYLTMSDEEFDRKYN